MSDWTEAERVKLRKILGYPSLFHQYIPKLENAINSVRSTTDGGALPDSSTQDDIRATLVKIASVESKIENLYDQIMIDEAGDDKIKINATRSLYVLKQEGRRFINHIAIQLGTAPIRDYFATQPLGDPDYPLIIDKI